MNISLPDIAAIVTAIILVYKALTTTPVEAQRVEVDTIKQYQEIVAAEVDRGMKLNERIEELRTSIGERDAKIADRDKIILDYDCRIKELENAVDLLSHQIMSMGLKPVIEKPIKKAGI